MADVLAKYEGVKARVERTRLTLELAAKRAEHQDRLKACIGEKAKIIFYF